MPSPSLASSVLNAQHCPLSLAPFQSHPQGTSWLHVAFLLRGHGQLDQSMPCHLVDGNADMQRPGQPACGRPVCSLVCRMFIALAIPMRQLLFLLGVGDRTWWLQSAGRVKGEATKPSNWKSGTFEWAGLGDCLREAVAIPRCRSEERILHEWRVVCSVRLRSGGPFSCSVSAHGPAQLPSKPGLTCVHHRGGGMSAGPRWDSWGM